MSEWRGFDNGIYSFPPEAINTFSGDSSRTEKAALGNLTHGLLVGGEKVKVF